MTAVTVSNHGRGGWLGRTKLDVTFPQKEIRTTDMVSLPGSGDGTTVYRR